MEGGGEKKGIEGIFIGIFGNVGNPILGRLGRGGKVAGFGKVGCGRFGRDGVFGNVGCERLGIGGSENNGGKLGSVGIFGIVVCSKLRAAKLISLLLRNANNTKNPKMRELLIAIAE